MILAQIAGTPAACCVCCRKWKRELPTETRRAVDVVLSVVSWWCWRSELALFIAGGALHTDREEEATLLQNTAPPPAPPQVATGQPVTTPEPQQGAEHKFSHRQQAIALLGACAA
ncbi:hypothetical protein ACP4OV_003554 [Aristida adscensionis]